MVQREGGKVELHVGSCEKLARPNADNGPVVAKLTASEYVKLKAGLEQLELDGLEKPIKLRVEGAPTEALEKASSSKAPAGALEKATSSDAQT